MAAVQDNNLEDYFASITALRNSLMSLENDSVMDSDKNQRKQNLYMNFNQNSNSLVNSLGLAMSPMTNSYYSANDTIESVVGE